MSREIKFEFLYKGLPFSSESAACNWFKKVYYIEQLIVKPLADLSDVHQQAELVAKRQYTGLKDKKGTEAFEGDIVIAAMSDRNGKEIGTYVGQITFDEYEWSIEMESERFPLASWQLVDSFEVIGNIYQNPELLK